MESGNEFGDFFRETRKALGLSIAEFCRRNGFDKGNISRLERGLIPPPTSKKSQEQYAKALKLRKGTDRWNRYFELASAGTGRIPIELLQTAAKRIPKLIRKLRGGMGHQNWVKARQLEEWANTIESQSVLPKLVRRLVHATSQSMTHVEFPAGEQVQRPEFDGVTDTAETDSHVPQGSSVWELGVSKNPAGKAEKDFEKRRKQKLGFDKKTTTYVVVTPRKWQTKSAWIKAKNKLGIWNDVRVYDSNTLEEWLERAPAVDVWLAGVMQIRPAIGLTDLDDYWANLQALTEPSLRPEVFLASRKKQVEEFQGWLAEKTGAAVIKSRSPAEAVDFVAAVILQTKENDAFLSRTVIIEDREAWREISRTDAELILIAHPNLAVEPEMVADAVRRGHRVILPSSQMLTDRSFVLELPRVYRPDLQEALIASGIERNQASEDAKKAGGSLTVLKRLLAKLQGSYGPVWSRGAEAISLIPVLMAGAWEDTVEGDREALAHLSKRTYEEVLTTAQRWSDGPDSPLTQILSHWGLVSRDDSWHLLSYAITPETLGRLEKVALEVLGEDDPAYDLPPDERWMANIKNKTLRHSQTLRTGLAETMALFGGRPDAMDFAEECRAKIGHVVHCILHGQVWKRWASLSPQLPLLAEADPDAFMRSVEHDLAQTEPELPKLFEQDGKSLLHHSGVHASLLWALETLAWDRDILPRVCYALAKLDEKLLNKEMGNSPMRSLQAIFMPWYPQTTAPVEERIKILSVIAKKYPATGWRLLLGLLPEMFRTTSPIHRPSFRDWALAWKEGTKNAEYAQQVIACSNRLVDLLGIDTERWKTLIDQFEGLARPVADSFLEKLLTCDVTTFDTAARQIIAESLREKASKHRTYSEADWAMTADIVEKLDKAHLRFLPEDAVSRHRWLFNSIWEVLEHEGQQNEAEVAVRRKSAIHDVRSEGGWNGILSLVASVRMPDELGWVMGEIGNEEDDRRILPTMLTEPNEKLAQFARSYGGSRFQKGGWEWVKTLSTHGWLGEQLARFALVLSVDEPTWDFVSQHSSDAESYYWNHLYRSISNPSAASVTAAVKTLLRYQRPFQACFTMDMAGHRNCPLDTDLAIEVLNAGLEDQVSEKEKMAIGDRRRNMLELIQHVQKAAKNGTEELQQQVAKIEWVYLSLLNGYPVHPELLHNWLKSRPEFFDEILGLVYRGDNEEEHNPPSEKEQSRAQNAFRLLMSWKSLPGSQDDKSVDSLELLKWIRKARELAKGKARLAISDQRIGEVLAHGPSEQTDGGWPCIPVRDAIEEAESEELMIGFEIGIQNKRGAYWKSLSDGGSQEREYATRFRKWSELCKVDWPRTATSLRRVAESYERQAAREDAATELRLS